MKLSSNAIALAVALGSAGTVHAVEPEDTVTAALRLPVVGESVAIAHRSDTNAGGYANLVDAPVSHSVVKRVLQGDYPHKRVMVESGDVWDVVLADAKGKGSVWITKRVRYHG